MVSALLFALALGQRSEAGTGWKIAKAPLVTRWAREVSPKNALPEYPRPQMRRREWLNLNGLWEFTMADANAEAPIAYGERILVPYPMESALSGLGRASAPEKRLWYRRSFAVPDAWRGRRMLLHFGAVNWDAEVRVNGQRVGTHRGGFDPFSFDVTDALRSGANEVVVGVRNPLHVDHELAQPVGKQRLKGGGIFYTAASGIWQTVWLEPVPVARISDLKVTPDLASGTVGVRVGTEGTVGERVEVVASERSRTIARTLVSPGTEARLTIPNPRLWTPETPHLYDLRVRLLAGNSPQDTVESYFAMRSISLGKDEGGRTTMLLNGKPYFQIGTLDQGYWPDGIYTAPTDTALKWDIEETKRLGFNTIRKHAKVEPDRWYYWADRLGVLVWQDMPQSFGKPERGVEGGVISDEGREQWDLEWSRIMAALQAHPSIVVWTPFNEGWGQHDTERITKETKERDPSRLVNSASGWFDKGFGDLDDVHDYPGPGSHSPSAARAAVNGEFGGITRRISGHMWTEDVFGYGQTLSDEWSVTSRYQDLLRRAYDLRRDKGTIAFVYTQFTDVEQESNGLWTYDRAVRKADPRIVAAANRGRFPAMGPNPNPPILPTAADTPQTWRIATEAPPRRVGPTGLRRRLLARGVCSIRPGVGRRPHPVDDRRPLAPPRGDAPRSSAERARVPRLPRRGRGDHHQRRPGGDREGVHDRLRHPADLARSPRGDATR